MLTSDCGGEDRLRRTVWFPEIGCLPGHRFVNKNYYSFDWRYNSVYYLIWRFSSFQFDENNADFAAVRWNSILNCVSNDRKTRYDSLEGIHS